MYSDDQLQDMRFQFSRALEDLRRQIQAFTGDKNELWPIYDGLSAQLHELGQVVWQIPSSSVWNQPYTAAVNDLDQATQQFAYAQGDNDEQRPHYLAQAVDFLNQAVSTLAN
ncbi:MAG TPA: hypothetical protein VG435_14615 [Acidimicrobiales bacterium]|jgi:hypothetical protein|nr:hypothetical protein [Acidimicrobiales bacterium]